MNQPTVDEGLQETFQFLRECDLRPEKNADSWDTNLPTEDKGPLPPVVPGLMAGAGA